MEDDGELIERQLKVALNPCVNVYRAAKRRHAVFGYFGPMQATMCEACRSGE